jgi:hypothetical protein
VKVPRRLLNEQLSAIGGRHGDIDADVPRRIRTMWNPNSASWLEGHEASYG